jgi:hypothetical protein
MEKSRTIAGCVTNIESGNVIWDDVKSEFLITIGVRKNGKASDPVTIGGRSDRSFH